MTAPGWRGFRCVLAGRDGAMDLHQLRIFVVVAEAQHLTKGAQRLHMTPPTVSAHLKALEEELGVTLFVRTPKGMLLTARGAQLKPYAEQTLHAAQALRQQAMGLRPQLMGQVRCGLSATPSFLRVAPLVHALQRTAAGVRLEFLGSTSGAIVEALAQETLDVGYLFGAPPVDSLTTHLLTQAEVVIAAPAPWAARLATADWSDVAQLPWIASDGYCAFEALTHTLLQQRGLRCEHVVQSHDELTKAELVAAGVGLAMLERSEAEREHQAGRLVIWQTAPLYCPLSFAYRTPRRADPLLSAVRAAVLHVWRDPCDGAAP